MVDAAIAVGRENEFGSLRVGRTAETIAVDVDTLEDIASFLGVDFVMKAGEIYREPAS